MRVWIINHYAIPPSMGGLVRHYYFSRYLQEKGHKVKIFSASKIHNTDINMIKDKSLYRKEKVDGIEYTFVRTSDYKGNGICRIRNLLQFPLRIFKVCKHFKKPDVIYTSSPDLFTAFSAVLLAKYLRVKKVVEVRDLWPESIVEYSGFSRKNPIIWILYQLEKWIYKNADELIFTMAGGKKYIKDKGWDKKINLEKVHHVNNGVDLKEFEYNKEHFKIEDADLEDLDSFKVVYTGSIRKVNHLETVVECAKISKKENSNIKFLIWGDGSEREKLEQKCLACGIDNIIFKGKVDKKYIPYILAHADVNLMHGMTSRIMRYGCSPNKLFEYFAAGKVIFSDIGGAYDLIKKYKCGLVKRGNDPKILNEEIKKIWDMNQEKKDKMQDNAKKCANKYDYIKLTEKIEKILETKQMRRRK